MLTGLNIVELASLNMVGLASLNMVELDARTWLLTSLFMHVGTYCSWLDERTYLNDVVRTIMIKQQPCSCMIEHAVRE